MRGLVPYVAMAASAGVLGGIIAVFWHPGVRTRGSVQHFAAGIVIAAVASDLMPDVQRNGTPPGILGGFITGGLVMIALKWFVLRFERKETGRQLPVGLASAAAMDTLIDGAIIAAGFASGERVGAVLALALSIELFFLTLSVGTEFRRHRWTGILTTTGIALLLVVGAAAASWLLAGAPETTVAIVLAFGAAALIYLIAEELLVESIEAEESLFSTAMLFAGFVAALAISLYTTE